MINLNRLSDSQNLSEFTNYIDDEKEEERAYAHWLHQIEGIGDKTCIRLIDIFHTAKEIYEVKEEYLTSVLNKKQCKALDEAKKQNVLALYQELKEKKLVFHPFYLDSYPTRLREVPDMPFGLYVKGNLPLDNKRSVAIVGARDCSGYGEYVAEKFALELSQNDIQVISGLARGIDGIAGRAALGGTGGSYAVLGCGADICYPSSHHKLYEEISEKGGILSAYPSGTEPKPSLFPPRNRIISGLSDVVLVIEARQKSGTLITVDMALEQGREVYVIPGRITDRLSDGCNNLLLQGAGAAVTPSQLIRDLSETIWSNYKKQILTNKEKRSSDETNEEERMLLSIIEFQLMTIEQIYEKVSAYKILMCKPLPDIISMLTNLVIKGYVRCEGGYYKRVNEV